MYNCLDRFIFLALNQHLVVCTEDCLAPVRQRGLKHWFLDLGGACRLHCQINSSALKSLWFQYQGFLNSGLENTHQQSLSSYCVLTEQGFQPNQTPYKVIKVNDEVFISKTSHNDLM